MDSGLDRRTRVLKYLGLLPLVSNHPNYEQLTIAAASDSHPVKRERLPIPPALRSPSVQSSSAPSQQPAGNTLLTRAGELRLPRSKSALNYFQDVVRSSIRAENPGLSMPELRQKMMETWKEMSDQEKAPYTNMVSEQQARLRAKVLASAGVTEKELLAGLHGVPAQQEARAFAASRQLPSAQLLGDDTVSNLSSAPDSSNDSTASRASSGSAPGPWSKLVSSNS